MKGMVCRFMYCTYDGWGRRKGRPWLCTCTFMYDGQWWPNKNLGIIRRRSMANDINLRIIYLSVLWWVNCLYDHDDEWPNDVLKSLIYKREIGEHGNSETLRRPCQLCVISRFSFCSSTTPHNLWHNKNESLSEKKFLIPSCSSERISIDSQEWWWYVVFIRSRSQSCPRVS